MRTALKAKDSCALACVEQAARVRAARTRAHARTSSRGRLVSGQAQQIFFLGLGASDAGEAGGGVEGIARSHRVHSVCQCINGQHARRHHV